MITPIRLYISAGPDLRPERETLGRAVTEIPVDVGWEITHTPRNDRPVDPQTVAAADVHLLLVGIDIRAPVGREWFAARRAGRSPALFLKRDVARTMAAQDFVRHLQSQSIWKPFQDAMELRRNVLILLGDHLAQRAGELALTPTERERLTEFRSGLGTSDSGEEGPRHGAGESGVILSRDRYEPSSGTLIEPEGKEA